MSAARIPRDRQWATDGARHAPATLGGILLRPQEELIDLDGLVLAVPHAEYVAAGVADIENRLRRGGVVMDVKSVLPPDALDPSTVLWSL